MRRTAGATVLFSLHIYLLCALEILMILGLSAVEHVCD